MNEKCVFCCGSEFELREEARWDPDGFEVGTGHDRYQQCQNCIEAGRCPTCGRDDQPLEKRTDEFGIETVGCSRCLIWVDPMIIHEAFCEAYGDGHIHRATGDNLLLVIEL